MSGVRSIKKGEILFREGDVSDAMFVIKSVRIAIMKAKGDSEIQLAELGAGDMLGEMGFFDNKPRSAGARALAETVVIELPFRALNSQFRTFPEWLKAIVRTVNNHLRKANQRIKNLETPADEDAMVFPPHTMTRLAGILALVAEKYGEPKDNAIMVPAGTLRRYTIQIFQQSTSKMQLFMETLQKLGYMIVEDLEEGRQRITMLHLDHLFGFVDSYNEYLFQNDEDRVPIEERELAPMRALMHYAKGQAVDAKGLSKVNLSQMQETAQSGMGVAFMTDDVNSLSEKKLIGEKMSSPDGIVVSFDARDVEKLLRNWTLVYALKAHQKPD